MQAKVNKLIPTNSGARTQAREDGRLTEMEVQGLLNFFFGTFNGMCVFICLNLCVNIV